MKILLVHAEGKDPRASIDLWRIIRPFNELKKHVDWQIDHQPFLIDQKLFKDKDFLDPYSIKDELVKEVFKLSEYDIVWSSYSTDAPIFDMIQFTGKKFGTKFVLDVDDDMYHIPLTNSIWKNAAKGPETVEDIKYMIRNTDYLVTSSPELEKEMLKHRPKSYKTYLWPNYIGSDYKHKPFKNNRVTIGFFGSLTHKEDLEKSGFNEALQKLMHKHKNVHFGSVGLEVKDYLPKARYHFHPGKSGKAWITEIWPNINIDIAVAPLLDIPFNRCKTNIKWLEASMIPAAFIGTNIPPYKGTVEHDKTGLLVNNSPEEWLEALEELVVDAEKRHQLAQTAQKEVKKNWMINHHWMDLKKIVEDICG